MKSPELATRRSFDFGPFCLNPVRRTLFHGSKRVALTSKAFDLLLALIEHRGQVVEKEALMRLVWPGAVVEENNLAQSIAAIRKALGDGPGEYQYVLTIPGRGYSFAADVSETVPEPAPTTRLLPFPVEPEATGRFSWLTIRRNWTHILLASLGLMVLTVIALIRPHAPAASARVTRIPLTLPEGIGGFLLSPDGENLLFTTAAEKPETRIFSFASGQSRPIPIPGVAGAFWSPDSRWIGFVDGRQLRRMDISSGGVRTIWVMQGPTPAAPWEWSPAAGADGSILFEIEGHGIFRLAGEGGKPEQLTKVSRLDRFHVGIQLLPDNRRFLFTALAPIPAEVRVSSIDAKPPVRLARIGSPALYASPGYLLYLRGDLLIAQPFDAGRAALTAPPQLLIDGVARTRLPEPGPPGGLPQLSVSQTGVLIYRPGTRFQKKRLTWFDRSGNATGTVAEPADWASPALSPDGKRLAVNRNDPQTGSHVWILDLERGSRTRLTTDAAPEGQPVWSPDGLRVAFGRNRNGGEDLYVADPSNPGKEQLLLADASYKHLEDWSRDGAWLSYFTQDQVRAGNAWLLPMSGSDRKPTLFRTNGSDQSRFSPDGKFIAYRCVESGHFEIVVQALASGGGRWQVSTRGGQEPQWRADGKELFYLGMPSTLMAVDIKLSGDTLAPGIPRPLFETPRLAYQRNRYVATADGRRFLVVVPEDEGPPQPPVLVQNWPALLGKGQR